MPRPRRKPGRPLAEAAQRLDVAQLHRAGWLVQGQVTRGRLDQGGLWIRVDLSGYLPPCVYVTDFLTGYPREQVVALVTTRSRVGTTRWWFRCPRTGRRSRVLYRPRGAEQLASREAHGLAYRSQRQTDAARAAARAGAAAARLGLSGATPPAGRPVARPRGMHAATFRRLVAIIEAAPPCR